jgi:hypothetical protein
MATSASYALRAALITLTKADATLATILGGTVQMYDHVPEDAVIPYIEYRSSARTWDTTTDRGDEFDVSINVWSHAEGSKQCEDVMRRIDEIWRAAAPSLTDHRLVNLERQFQDIIREEGGQTYHGFQRWRAVTEEV